MKIYLSIQILQRGIINFSNNLIDERIQIFSINGEKVYDRTITNNSIDLDLQSGFYLLKISTIQGF